MEKKASNDKTTHKTSQPKPDELKPKAIKGNQKQQIKKKKESHHSLNPMDLTKGKKWKKKPQMKKTKKNPSQPKPDEIKPKAINWKKKQQIKKNKKNP